MGVGQACRVTNTPSGEKGRSEQGRAGELRCQAEPCVQKRETWRKLVFVTEVRNVERRSQRDSGPQGYLKP